jgi:hypothetical protein
MEKQAAIINNHIYFHGGEIAQKGYVDDKVIEYNPGSLYLHISISHC